MPARTGEEFLKGLRSRKPEVWIGNERVDDITEHPGLKGGAESLASVFDRQYECAEQCLIPDPETGEQINISHIIPRSVDDLRRRRKGLTKISETTMGLMGRTPDYMNVTFAGFAGQPTLWRGPDGVNDEGYENLVAFQKRIRRDDVSLTHTIVHPTNDRAIDRSLRTNHVPLRKVGETKDSIIVRGARILSTLAPYADELAVYPGHPLFEPDCSEFALSFSIPMDTPGLIFLCRDSTLTPDANVWDRPLSTRFDEQDAFVIFDNVEIPKKWVFINGSEETYNTAMHADTSSWWANVMAQTTTRALTKLEFCYGLASKMAEFVGDNSDMTIDMIGEIGTYVEATRNSVELAELQAYDYGDGYVFPAGRPMHIMRALIATWIPRVHDILMVIGSHNLLATPSRAMFDDERLRPLIDTFMFGANGVTAEERATVYRITWDFIGSALGARNELYERNYLGSPKTTRLNYARGYQKSIDRSHQLLADFIARYHTA
jgi:4-hydroxyphenylacetate 3-monooxygenase